MGKPRVFIGYTHEDSEFVDDFAIRLRASRVDVWIDKWKIKIGDSITQRINEGIGESDFLIIVLSQASVKSKWVQEELNAALVRDIETEKHAFILPVLKEDCEIPILLKHRKYANFKEDPGGGFQALIETISPYRDFEPELVRIPAGEFLMGTDDADPWDDGETPQHRVLLSEYSIGRNPVTNREYQLFVVAKGYAVPGHWKGAKHPKGEEDHRARSSSAASSTGVSDFGGDRSSVLLARTTT